MMFQSEERPTRLAHAVERKTDSAADAPAFIFRHVSWYHIQYLALLMLAGALLLSAPKLWNWTPDGGIYVGTAQNLLEKGTYTFNGYPNLLYYPGTSLFLAAIMWFVGENFAVFHILFTGFGIVTLWLLRSYYREYPAMVVAVGLPIIVGLNGLFIDISHKILSDMLFLALTVAALLLWKKYEARRSKSIGLLLLCALVVAFAPLVRFQGLFLWGAFVIAVIWKTLARRTWKVGYFTLFLIVATAAPFVLWTLRNYLLYTPETFNMVLDNFFGLKGLLLHAPGSHTPEWMQGLPLWKVAAYRLDEAARLFLGYSFGNRFEGILPLKMLLPGAGFLLFLGFSPWFRNANVLERIYVISSMLFLVRGFSQSDDMHVIGRYWLPMIPFMVNIFLLAGQRVFNSIGRKPFLARVGQGVRIAISAILIILMVHTGVGTLANHMRIGFEKKLDKNHEAINEIVEFFEDSVAKDAIVATTDWGVMPFYLKRKCIKVLNDASHLLSLRLLSEWKASYLVILDGWGGGSPACTRGMVAEYPDLFEELLSGNGYSIYRIDNSDLQTLLFSLQG